MNISSFFRYKTINDFILKEYLNYENKGLLLQVQISITSHPFDKFYISIDL